MREEQVADGCSHESMIGSGYSRRGACLPDAATAEHTVSVRADSLRFGKIRHEPVPDGAAPRAEKTGQAHCGTAAVADAESAVAAL